jgi:hypothetical protein
MLASWLYCWLNWLVGYSCVQSSWLCWLAGWLYNWLNWLVTHVVGYVGWLAILAIGVLTSPWGRKIWTRYSGHCFSHLNMNFDTCEKIWSICLIMRKEGQWPSTSHRLKVL